MMWDLNKSNLQLVMNIRDSDPYCFTHGDCFFGHRLRIGDIVISDGSKQFLFILSIKGRLEKQNNKNSELILHILSKRVSDNPNYVINLALPTPPPLPPRKFERHQHFVITLHSSNFSASFMKFISGKLIDSLFSIKGSHID